MSTHIIRRQMLDVEVLGTESEGFALQRMLLDLCQARLNPALEAVLDRSIPPEEHWTIDHLDIDAGSFKPEQLESHLVGAVTLAIERHLREKASSARSHLSPGPLQRHGQTQSARQATGSNSEESEIGTRTEDQHLQLAFLHFLETGLLPWWFRLPEGKTLEDLVRESWEAEDSKHGRPQQLARAAAEKIQSLPVRRRLVRQFSREFLEKLLAAISTEACASVLETLTRLGRFESGDQALVLFSTHVWEIGFGRAIAGQPVSAEIIVADWMDTPQPSSGHLDVLRLERIAELLPEAKRREQLARDLSRKATPKSFGSRSFVPSPATDAARKEQTQRIDLGEGVFANCAGVVLLHPFLPRLFEALGIAKDDELLQPERALGLLHFLSTGQRVAPEYDLALPKLLCNMSLETVVESRQQITTEEEEEAVALLTAVIRHWDALGNSSVDGLRGSFLVRPGKITRRGGEDILQMEAQSYDILLDRLPWGIGLIKLPWMERTLWVEWRF